MLVMNIKLFLCALTFAAYLYEFMLSLIFYSGFKWPNISYQYDGNCMLKNYINFVPLQEKKSATIPKHIKEFLKSKN